MTSKKRKNKKRFHSHRKLDLSKAFKK